MSSKCKKDLNVISVVVCTYNRAESLRETIYSLLKQDLKAVPMEILVVDNNSSDNTKNVVASFGEGNQFPIRCVFEGQQGLGYARNTGIQAAKGEIIAFIDDDIEVEPVYAQPLPPSFQ